MKHWSNTGEWLLVEPEGKDDNCQNGSHRLEKAACIVVQHKKRWASTFVLPTITKEQSLPIWTFPKPGAKPEEKSVLGKKKSGFTWVQQRSWLSDPRCFHDTERGDTFFPRSWTSYSCVIPCIFCILLTLRCQGQRVTFSDNPANHPPWSHWSNQIPLVHKYHLIGILRLGSTLMILSFWSPNPASAPQQSSGQSAPVAGRVRMFSLASFSLALYLNSHSPEKWHNAVTFHWMELTRRGALSKYKRKHPGKKEERNHGLADRIVWLRLKFPTEEFQLTLPDTDTLKGSRMGCSHKKKTTKHGKIGRLQTFYFKRPLLEKYLKLEV